MDEHSPEIEQKVEQIDALLWAMDCNTLGRARERAIPGERHPPQRLRSENQYQGLPYLHERGNEDLLERVLNANTLVRFSAHTLDKAIRLGIATSTRTTGCSRR